MKSLNEIDMVEVTRLTRAGLLEKAMRLLQGLSRRDDSTEYVSANVERAVGPLADISDMVDMEPPSAANGGAWTKAASTDEGNFARRRTHQDSAGSATQPSLSALNYLLKPRIRAGLAPRAVIHVPTGARYEERTCAGSLPRHAYTVYVPSNHDGTPRSLVVMLHGCSQSPDDFALGTRMNELAEEYGFLVAYPAQAKAANASGCWNWFSPAEQRRDGAEPAFIAGITRALVSEFSIDRGRVYVAGLSAGGAMAAIMGETYPELYAGVGVHSGLAPGSAVDMPSAFAAMRKGGPPRNESANHSRPVPTIVFHGDADATVHPINADRVASRLSGAPPAVVRVSAGTTAGGISYTRTVESDVDGQPLVEQWSVHGAGHAWSGGNENGSFVEPRGPDASRAMWQFFSRQVNAGAAPR